MLAFPLFCCVEVEIAKGICFCVNNAIFKFLAIIKKDAKFFKTGRRTCMVFNFLLYYYLTVHFYTS